MSALDAAVAVFGAGGHAKVVLSTLQAMGTSVAGVYDDSKQTWGSVVYGERVRGPIGLAAQEGVTHAVIAVGSNAARAAISNRHDLQQCSWATLVHPRAYVDPSVKIGAGTVVFAGAVLQPDAVVGSHCIVNTSASVDHDAVLGDFAQLCPGVHLCGGVTVGRSAFLGVAASVAPLVRIGDFAVIGAGSVVLRDVPERAFVAGVPAASKDPR